MKKDFLTYSTGVYEVPVKIARAQVSDVVEDAKRLDSFVCVEVLGLKDNYTVTVMLKDTRDVTWFRLRWL